MEKSRYRLPVLKRRSGKENEGSKDMYETMVSLEKTHSSIIYRKYSQNEFRKRKNDLQMIKKKILKHFKF